MLQSQILVALFICMSIYPGGTINTYTFLISDYWTKMEGIRQVEVRTGCKKCGYPGQVDLNSIEIISWNSRCYVIVIWQLIKASPLRSLHLWVPQFCEVGPAEGIGVGHKQLQQWLRGWGWHAHCSELIYTQSNHWRHVIWRYVIG